VTLLDWQGIGGIAGVVIESPDLINGLVNLSYDAPGLLPNEYIYTGTIYNQRNAPG
jgi:hypothetical protein